MYGHPEAVPEQARALAPACFSVTVTEVQRVVRACRILSMLRRGSEASPFLSSWGLFSCTCGGRRAF